MSQHLPSPPDSDAATLGARVVDWRPPIWPGFDHLEGRYVRLERLHPDWHGPELWEAFAEDQDDAIWRFLPYGPFETPAAHRAWLRDAAAKPDPMFFALRPRKADDGWGRASGLFSFLRIAPATGGIELGHICFGPSLQRTPAATEAMTLAIRWAFEAGYRRFEWKCNALNDGSRRAALRLGLSYEGVFRQATISKGRNRDTAWFAAIDAEWPALAAAYDQWLDPENFDAQGRQRAALSALTAPILHHAP